ncbi:WXG100 family type VII secretion target [Dactylosporangium sp. CS-033363]|uniref:WXG100 family type VII secretion target n=1 Tax=unclassified Dactylosporangium TaxID=2621675 RepID=UPI003D928768
MTQGTFNTGEISAHASLTRQRAEELQQAVANLRSAAQQLQAVWTGPGAQSFQGTREQWERAVVPLQESLASMGQALNQASQSYESNENTISRAFGK